MIQRPARLARQTVARLHPARLPVSLRPHRPTRWMYSLGSSGGSYCRAGAGGRAGRLTCRSHEHLMRSRACLVSTTKHRRCHCPTCRAHSRPPALHFPHLDDPVDRGDVEAARRHVCAQQDAAVGLAELEEGGGALGLGGWAGRGCARSAGWVRRRGLMHCQQQHARSKEPRRPYGMLCAPSPRTLLAPATAPR